MHGNPAKSPKSPKPLISQLSSLAERLEDLRKGGGKLRRLDVDLGVEREGRLQSRVVYLMGRGRGGTGPY